MNRHDHTQLSLSQHDHENTHAMNRIVSSIRGTAQGLCGEPWRRRGRRLPSFGWCKRQEFAAAPRLRFYSWSKWDQRILKGSITTIFFPSTSLFSSLPRPPFKVTRAVQRGLACRRAGIGLAFWAAQLWWGRVSGGVARPPCRSTRSADFSLAPSSVVRSPPLPLCLRLLDASCPHSRTSTFPSKPALCPRASTLPHLASPSLPLSHSLSHPLSPVPSAEKKTDFPWARFPYSSAYSEWLVNDFELLLYFPAHLFSFQISLASGDGDSREGCPCLPVRPR